MKTISKKFWIIIPVLFFTFVLLFGISLLITTDNGKFVIKFPTRTHLDMDYTENLNTKGGIYMDESPDSVVRKSTPEIMKTAEITISADNMDFTLSSIKELNRIYNASIINLQDSGKGSNRNISFTIKVEESKFENLYEKIKELPDEFISSSINTVDVTETVRDFKVRLSNLQKLEDQYNTILKSAKTIKDVLAVQKELVSTRTEIESIQTQLKDLENQTKYSYISIYMNQSSVGSQLSDNKWEPLGVLKDAFRLLIKFGKFIGAVLIYILVFFPVIAAIVIPVVIIQKRAKK